MTQLSIITPTELALQHLERLKIVQSEIDRLKKLQENLIRKIVFEMKEHEVLVSEDGEELVTYKYTKDVKYFDAKKFASDNPSLYNDYVSYKPGSRRFIVK